MRPRRLFVYGTLRDPNARAVLLGRRAARLHCVPAVLLGFRLLRSPRGDYAVLLHARAHRAAGLLLEPVAPADLRRLGRYEGNEYCCVLVRVRTSGCRWRVALAYLPRRARASGRGWDYARWLSRQTRARPDAVFGDRQGDEAWHAQ